MGENDTAATSKDCPVVLVIGDSTAIASYSDLCRLGTAGTVDHRLNIITATKFEHAWPLEKPRREKEYWKPKLERRKRRI